MDEELSTQNCSNNDVLLFGMNTFKLDKFRSVVKQSLKQAMPQFGSSMKQAGVDGEVERMNYDKWLEGVECQILKPGAADWQKGKIRLKVVIEFTPDNPPPTAENSDHTLTDSVSDPSLDAIRQMVIDDN